MNKRIGEYLEKRAVKGPWRLEIPNKLPRLSQVVVIPAYDELEDLPQLLESLEKNEQKICEETLLITVVNNKQKGITPDEVIERNQKTLDILRKIQNGNRYPFHIGIIDACSPRFEMPLGSGVGLVRKIGMDWATRILFDLGIENGGLICLDADCKVSENYLTEWKKFFEQYRDSAGIMAFAHPIDENELGKAMMFYEIFIRLYELCLYYANSPYSYIAIGSTIGINTNLYATVGGMSTKTAGEDFYFLQKIAKVAQIRRITSATVYPSARPSDRVRFGTGPKVKEYMMNPGKMNSFYSFNSFEILKKWIELLDEPLETPEQMLKEAYNIHPELMFFLESNHWIEKTHNIYLESKSKNHLSWRLHEWFDGLRTLRLIHHLRDKSFPNINIQVVAYELLEKIFNLKLYQSQFSPELILKLLREKWKEIENVLIGIKPHLIKQNYKGSQVTFN